MTRHRWRLKSLGGGRGVPTYLLMKPYPFLTLNHLTVPKTLVAATRQSAVNLTGPCLGSVMLHKDKLGGSDLTLN